MSERVFAEMRCLKCRLEIAGREPPAALICSCAPYGRLTGSGLNGHNNHRDPKKNERKPDPDGRLRRSASKHRRREIFARDRLRCRYCDVQLGLEDATLDHVMPWSRGGSRFKENLVTCCGPCNQEKRDRTPEEAGMMLLPEPTD